MCTLDVYDLCTEDFHAAVLFICLMFKLSEKVASGFRLGSLFSLGTPVSSTTYNWLIMTKPQYGRKSD